MNEATAITGTQIEAYRLLVAIKAIEIKLRTGMELTRNGCRMAINNVISPMTGKRYPASRKGKLEALADAKALLGRE